MTSRPGLSATTCGNSIEAHLTLVFAALAEARFLNTSRASPIWPAAGPTGPGTSGSVSGPRAAAGE